MASVSGAVSGGLGTVARLRKTRRRTSAGDAPEAFRAMWDRSGGGDPLPEYARRGHIAFGQPLATQEHLFVAAAAARVAPPRPARGRGGHVLPDATTEGAACTTLSPRGPHDVRQGFLDIAPFLLDPAGTCLFRQATCVRARPSAS